MTDPIELQLLQRYSERENSPSIYTTVQKVLPQKVRGIIDKVDMAIVTEKGRKRLRSRKDKFFRNKFNQ